jgi:hypothetical protein
MRTGVAGLLAVGVVGAVTVPSALAEIDRGASGPTGVAAASPNPGAPGSGSMGGGSTATAPHVVAAAPATWNAAAAAKFWTPARLDSATPVDPAPTRSAPHVAAQAVVPASSSVAHSTHFAGTSTTGVIFYAGRDLTTHYCTASVVDSHYGNLIVMAAHCNPGSWMAYVPKYQHGARVQPYGIWAVTKVYRDSHYTGGSGAGSDYDYAFAKVAPNSRGQQIMQVTGGNYMSPTPSYNTYVTALGYPKISADSRDQAIRCTPSYPTHRLSGFRQMVLYCTGFYGGTSGGPWLTHFNGRTGTIVGLTGGYQDGGPNSWISYSPIFDSRIFTLFHYAVYH